MSLRTLRSNSSNYPSLSKERIREKEKKVICYRLRRILRETGVEFFDSAFGVELSCCVEDTRVLLLFLLPRFILIILVILV